MANYKDDRNFTNYVHKNLAIPLIYSKLNWKEKDIDKEYLEFIDVNEGVDYVFESEVNSEIKLQERFRDSFYKQYNDCTLRYRRDYNSDKNRRESEFFKIKADYLVYGITDGKKFLDKRDTLTEFLKFVIVDLKVLFEKIDQGLIVFKEGRKTSYIKDNQMIAPINQNPDLSSSFVAFDILQLNQLFGNDNIILLQEGYF